MKPTYLFAVICLLTACYGWSTSDVRNRIEPEFLPLATRNILDVKTFMRNIAQPGQVWTQAYRLLSPTDTGSRQVRLFFNASADGEQLTRRLSCRSGDGSCILSTATYDLVSRRDLAIYERIDVNRKTQRREYFLSRCPSMYFTLYICFDVTTIARGRCYGDSLIGVFVPQFTPDQVPFELAVKDLRQFGVKFTDSRFRLMNTGEPCPTM